MKHKAAWILLLMALCLFSSEALAHKLNLYAYKEGSSFKGEGYYKGGQKAKKAVVKIMSKDGRMRAQSVTGNDGSFSLPIPKQPPPYTITMQDSEGHKAVFEIGEDQLDRARSEASRNAASDDPPHAENSGPVKGPVVDASRQELEAMVSRLLDQKLAPIKAQLARQAIEGEKVTVRDVVGGLGWILGLIGIAAWYSSRKSKAGPPASGGKGRQ